MRRFVTGLILLVHGLGVGYFASGMSGLAIKERDAFLAEAFWISLVHIAVLVMAMYMKRSKVRDVALTTVILSSVFFVMWGIIGLIIGFAVGLIASLLLKVKGAAFARTFLAVYAFYFLTMNLEMGISYAYALQVEYIQTVVSKNGLMLFGMAAAVHLLAELYFMVTKTNKPSLDATDDAPDANKIEPIKPKVEVVRKTKSKRTKTTNNGVFSRSKKGFLENLDRISRS